MKALTEKLAHALDALAAHRHRWLIVLGLALATRILGAALGGEGIRRGDDDGMHLGMAMNFLKGEGYWMIWEELGPLYCFQPPGLATFHVIFIKLFQNFWFAERVFFVLMSAGTGLVFDKLASRLFSSRTAIALTLIFLLYPPQWFWSTRINSHTYSTNMLIIGFFLLFAMWRRPRVWAAFGVGLLWATISQMRPEYMLGIFSMALGTWWFLKGNPRRILIPAILILGWVVGLSPWVIRNYMKVGKLVLSSTHYSYNFWMVYNDQYTYGGHNFATPPELHARLKASKETEMVDIWVEEGINYIKADPVRALKRTLLNLANFWRPWLSFSDIRLAENLLYIVSWVPIFVLFLIGIFRIPWREPAWLVIWTFMLYKMAAQVPFYMIVRFREAIFPLFVLIAGLGLTRWLESIKKRPDSISG